MSNLRLRTRTIAVGLGAALLAAGSAGAEDAPGAYPRLSGELSFEVEDDLTFESDDRAAELNDIFATIELGASLKFTEALSLNLSAVFEPVLDPVDDREFEDHGAFVEEIYLRYDAGVLAAVVGKFNPAFGTAWDLAPGIYGADFAEDYELTERIGGGVEVPFAAGGAEHVFTLAAFFADTTFLSDSAGENRGRVRERDGGPSNTEDPASFSATLDGGLPDMDVAYHLGLRFQSGGDGDPEDETGFVAGLSKAWSIDEDSTFEAIGEVAYFEDQDAGAADGVYGTLGGAYSWRSWTASAVYTLRDLEDGLDPDHLLTAALAYEFDFGLGVEVGYKFAEEGEVDSHTVGALVGYTVEF